MQTLNQQASAAGVDLDDFFIQPKITGYRQLTEVDASQINRIKELAAQVGAQIDILTENGDADRRWVNIATTQLQQGFMALVRSVAQPTSF